MEKCLQLRSKKSRDQMLRVLMDLYEEHGMRVEYEVINKDHEQHIFYYPDGPRDVTIHRLTVYEADGTVRDSAICEHPIPLIRNLFRGRPRP